MQRAITVNPHVAIVIAELRAATIGGDPAPFDIGARVTGTGEGHKTVGYCAP